MKKVLLLDDDKKYLADTIKELQLSGCDIQYSVENKEGETFIADNSEQLGIVVVVLNNALRYPTIRKIKRTINNNTQLCIYTDSDNTSLREWIYKQEVSHLFIAPFQKSELIEHCKKTILNKNIHFSHNQLLGLTNTLSKYTKSADNLVQQHAANSNSIQELQHKLARSLTSFDHQKKFLTEVQ